MRSIPCVRNIAEGFAADTHGQFASNLRISRRSYNELGDAFISAEQWSLVTTADLVAPRRLMRRLLPALNRFIACLEEPEANESAASIGWRWLLYQDSIKRAGARWHRVGESWLR